MAGLIPGHSLDMQQSLQFYTSPIGELQVEASTDGITKVVFCDARTDEQPNPHTQQCIQQLQEYFAGERKEFSCRLSPYGTAFQQQVWHLLQHIPYGTTVSYKMQALRLGDVKSIRAVASANGKNPIAILIPCHRVVGTNGKLTGYAGGLWRKQWLLEHEQAISTGFKKLI